MRVNVVGRTGVQRSGRALADLRYGMSTMLSGLAALALVRPGILELRTPRMTKLAHRSQQLPSTPIPTALAWWTVTRLIETPLRAVEPTIVPTSR